MDAVEDGPQILACKSYKGLVVFMLKELKYWRWLFPYWHVSQKLSIEILFISVNWLQDFKTHLSVWTVGCPSLLRSKSTLLDLEDTVKVVGVQYSLFIWNDHKTNKLT